MSHDLVTALAGAVACGGVGALLPRLVARLPEPAPGPPSEPEPGVEPTRAEQDLVDEGEKETYAELAARPAFRTASSLVAAVAGALLGFQIGWSWVLLLVLPLAPLGAVLALIDLRTRLLPRLLVLPATGAAVVYGLVAWPLTGSSDALVRGVAGLAVAWAVFAVAWFVLPRGMGYGDVRLAALLGFVLAYLGWAQFAVGLYSPFLLFGLPGLVLAIVRRDRALLRKAFPFGPALLAGALLGVLVGAQLL